MGFQVLEFFIAWYQEKKTPRLNDTFSSLAAGMISHLPK
jgi:HAMP domain-containing protein